MVDDLIGLNENLIQYLLDYLPPLLRRLSIFYVTEYVLVDDLAGEADLVLDVLKYESKKLLRPVLVEKLAPFASFLGLFVLKDYLPEVVEQIFDLIFGDLEIRVRIFLALVYRNNLIRVYVTQTEQVIEGDCFVHFEVHIVLLLQVCDQVSVVHDLSLVAFVLDLLGDYPLVLRKVFRDRVERLNRLSQLALVVEDEEGALFGGKVLDPIYLVDPKLVLGL